MTEYLIERIEDSRIKKYFKEVVTSYNNQNYRSSVVMLYTVVICDLTYKLKEMDEVYRDEKATDILTEIRTSRSNNQRASEWENLLVAKIHERTSLIDNALKSQIDFLKMQRNLSAHPEIDEYDILYEPSKETTIALITNIVEELLSKPAIYTQNVIEHFMESISNNKEVFVKDVRLKRYLEDNFFKHFNDELKIKVFKLLWKLVFNKDDSSGEEKAIENREINFQVMVILYREYSTVFRNDFDENAIKYKLESMKKENLELIAKFMESFPEVFDKLADHDKDTLRSNVEESGTLVYEFPILFVELEEHWKYIKDNILNEDDFNISLGKYLNKEQTEYLYDKWLEYGKDKEFLDKLIELYAETDSYDIGNKSFEVCIEPFIEKFYNSQIKTIIEHSNDNAQLHNRRAAREDHKIIIDECKARQQNNNPLIFLNRNDIDLNDIELNEFENFTRDIDI